MLRSLQKTARIKRTRGFEKCLADAGVYLSHQLSFEFNQWSRVLIIVDRTGKLSVNKYITTGIHIGRVGDIIGGSARRQASRPKAQRQQKRNASNIFCKSCFLFESRWWVWPGGVELFFARFFVNEWKPQLPGITEAFSWKVFKRLCNHAALRSCWRYSYKSD